MFKNVSYVNRNSPYCKLYSTDSIRMFQNQVKGLLVGRLFLSCKLSALRTHLMFIQNALSVISKVEYNLKASSDRNAIWGVNISFVKLADVYNDKSITITHTSSSVLYPFYFCLPNANDEERREQIVMADAIVTYFAVTAMSRNFYVELDCLALHKAIK